MSCVTPRWARTSLTETPAQRHDHWEEMLAIYRPSLNPGQRYRLASQYVAQERLFPSEQFQKLAYEIGVSVKDATERLAKVMAEFAQAYSGSWR